MAGNPKWNLTLDEWKKNFSKWVNEKDSQSLIDINIFFDFRGIYGDLSLANNLRNYLNSITERESAFFFHLSQEILRFKSPIGIFGKIQVDHD